MYSSAVTKKSNKKYCILTLSFFFPFLHLWPTFSSVGERRSSSLMFRLISRKTSMTFNPAATLNNCHGDDDKNKNMRPLSFQSRQRTRKTTFTFLLLLLLLAHMSLVSCGNILSRNCHLLPQLCVDYATRAIILIEK